MKKDKRTGKVYVETKDLVAGLLQENSELLTRIEGLNGDVKRARLAREDARRHAANVEQRAERAERERGELRVRLDRVKALAAGTPYGLGGGAGSATITAAFGGSGGGVGRTVNRMLQDFWYSKRTDLARRHALDASDTRQWHWEFGFGAWQRLVASLPMDHVGVLDEMSQGMLLYGIEVTRISKDLHNSEARLVFQSSPSAVQYTYSTNV